MICRQCGCELPTVTQKSQTVTNSRGQTMTTRELTLVTCETPDCQLRGYTFDAATYPERDLTAYLAVS